MSAENPISPKAIASTTGAGLGAAFATLVTWIIGVMFCDASSSAEKATDAIAAVPSPVSGVIALLVPAAFAALSGWQVADPHRITTAELQQLRSIQGGGTPRV